MLPTPNVSADSHVCFLAREVASSEYIMNAESIQAGRLLYLSHKVRIMLRLSLSRLHRPSLPDGLTKCVFALKDLWNPDRCTETKTLLEADDDLGAGIITRVEDCVEQAHQRAFPHIRWDFLPAIKKGTKPLFCGLNHRIIGLNQWHVFPHSFLFIFCHFWLVGNVVQWDVFVRGIYSWRNTWGMSAKNLFLKNTIKVHLFRFKVMPSCILIQFSRCRSSL